MSNEQNPSIINSALYEAFNRKFPLNSMETWAAIYGKPSRRTRAGFRELLRFIADEFRGCRVAPHHVLSWGFRESPIESKRNLDSGSSDVKVSKTKEKTWFMNRSVLDVIPKSAIYDMIQTPLVLEKLMAFGFLISIDSLISEVTVKPIQAVRTIRSIASKVIPDILSKVNLALIPTTPPLSTQNSNLANSPSKQQMQMTPSRVSQGDGEKFNQAKASNSNSVNFSSLPFDGLAATVSNNSNINSANLNMNSSISYQQTPTNNNNLKSTNQESVKSSTPRISNLQPMSSAQVAATATPLSYINKDNATNFPCRFLTPTGIAGSLKVISLVLTALIFMKLDISAAYHFFRAQALVKTFVLFNMIEVFERLMRTFGRDISDTLVKNTLRAFILLQKWASSLIEPISADYSEGLSSTSEIKSANALTQPLEALGTAAAVRMRDGSESTINEGNADRLFVTGKNQSLLLATSPPINKTATASKSMSQTYLRTNGSRHATTSNSQLSNVKNFVLYKSIISTPSEDFEARNLLHVISPPSSTSASPAPVGQVFPSFSYQGSTSFHPNAVSSSSSSVRKKVTPPSNSFFAVLWFIIKFSWSKVFYPFLLFTLKSVWAIVRLASPVRMAANFLSRAAEHAHGVSRLLELQRGQMDWSLFVQTVMSLGGMIIYLLLHSCVHLLRVLALNIAMNSTDTAMLLIMMTNNFGEIKSTVFKKQTTKTLFSLIASDIIERVYLVCDAVIIYFRTQGATVTRSNAPLFSTIPSWLCAILFLETAVDWVKHSFLLKYNSIPVSVFESYLELIISDVLLARAPLPPYVNFPSSNMLTSPDKTNDLPPPIHATNLTLGTSNVHASQRPSPPRPTSPSDLPTPPAVLALPFSNSTTPAKPHISDNILSNTSTERTSLIGDLLTPTPLIPVVSSEVQQQYVAASHSLIASIMQSPAPEHSTLITAIRNHATSPFIRSRSISPLTREPSPPSPQALSEGGGVWPSPRRRPHSISDLPIMEETASGSQERSKEKHSTSRRMYSITSTISEAMQQQTGPLPIRYDGDGGRFALPAGDATQTSPVDLFNSTDGHSEGVRLRKSTLSPLSCSAGADLKGTGSSVRFAVGTYPRRQHASQPNPESDYIPLSGLAVRSSSLQMDSSSNDDLSSIILGNIDKIKNDELDDELDEGDRHGIFDGLQLERQMNENIGLKNINEDSSKSMVFSLTNSSRDVGDDSDDSGSEYEDSDESSSSFDEDEDEDDSSQEQNVTSMMEVADFAPEVEFAELEGNDKNTSVNIHAFSVSANARNLSLKSSQPSPHPIVRYRYATSTDLEPSPTVNSKDAFHATLTSNSIKTPMSSKTHLSHGHSSLKVSIPNRALLRTPNISHVACSNTSPNINAQQSGTSSKLFGGLNYTSSAVNSVRRFDRYRHYLEKLLTHTVVEAPFGSALTFNDIPAYRLNFIGLPLCVLLLVSLPSRIWSTPKGWIALGLMFTTLMLLKILFSIIIVYYAISRRGRLLKLTSNEFIGVEAP